MKACKKLFINTIVIFFMMMQPMIMSNAMAEMPIDGVSSSSVKEVSSTSMTAGFNEHSNHQNSANVSDDIHHHGSHTANDCCSTAACCVMSTSALNNTSLQLFRVDLSQFSSLPLVSISLAVEIKPPRTISI